jgi:aryl-alcohol dehydrogenase-like predicted oxidoreductase
VALAWVLSRGEDVVAIPGTKHVARLEENVAATTVTLTPEDLASLEAAGKTVQGQRYPDALLGSLHRD